MSNERNLSERMAQKSIGSRERKVPDQQLSGKISDQRSAFSGQQKKLATTDAPDNPAEKAIHFPQIGETAFIARQNSDDCARNLDFDFLTLFKLKQECIGSTFIEAFIFQPIDIRFFNLTIFEASPVFEKVIDAASREDEVSTRIRFGIPVDAEQFLISGKGGLNFIRQMDTSLITDLKTSEWV